MQIHSRVLGVIDIDPAQIINFPEGIPAFEEEKEFVVLPLEEGPFFYLQAVKNDQLCLLTVNPFILFPDYQVDLPDVELEKLQVQENEKSLAVYAIINIPEDFHQTTTNLMAPIIINTSRKKGLQFIPAKSDYKTKHLLFEARAQVAAQAQEGC